MRVIHTKSPLPRIWTNNPQVKGIVLESDLAIGSSRLRAKLLVFDKAHSLRAFWKAALGRGELGRYCCGAVNGLYREVWSATGKQSGRSHLEVDPRYFCIIGLLKQRLSMEIISHEAVHAAFAYAKRIKRSPWDQQAQHFDEEAICYPAGRIAATINRALHAGRMYPW